jgi:DNA-binding SARP family transcriptional activator
MLGPLDVVRDGEPVELPGGKARLLLAALLVNPNRVVSTDRLFEVLWGPEVPGSAQNLLQTYVSRMRDALEPGRARRAASGYLVTQEPGYLLSIDLDRIDAVRLEHLAGEGRRALASAPDVAAATLRSALALWRGDPLADFTFEPFAQAEITRLTELRLAALEDRVQADLARGAHAELCGELGQLVCEHPLRERLWGHLMVALYRSDRQADALAAFRRLRATLVDQLGIEPSPALARLNDAILNHSPELEWTGAPPEPEALRIPAVAPPLDPLDETLPSEGPPDALEQARRALATRDWQGAFELLSAADDGALGGEDLDGLAEAALWAGRPHESLAARQRAHSAFIAAGDRRRAAVVAVVLCLHHAARGHLAVAGGWFQRAHRLLEKEPECPEQGFLAWAAAMFAIGGGDLGAGLEHARRAHDVGRQFGVPDLQAVGLTFQGWVLVRQGEPARGLLLMDEGMTWAVGGGLAPLVSALIFCRTIGTCFELGDYRRARRDSGSAGARRATSRAASTQRGRRPPSSRRWRASTAAQRWRQPRRAPGARCCSPTETLTLRRRYSTTASGSGRTRARPMRWPERDCSWPTPCARSGTRAARRSSYAPRAPRSSRLALASTPSARRGSSTTWSPLATRNDELLVELPAFRSSTSSTCARWPTQLMSPRPDPPL